MLSILSKGITARHVRKALSQVTGTDVNNQNTIRQATAKSAGFDSFEQASALCSRSNRIWDSVWVERNTGGRNNWKIAVLNIELIICTEQLSIYINDFHDNIGYMALPEILRGYQFSEDNIAYCHHMKKVVFSIPERHVSLVFHRESSHKLGISVVNHSASFNGVQYKEIIFSDVDFGASEVWLNDRVQIPRLLAECVMNCEDTSEIERIANTYGFSGQDMQAACDTALWLFEEDKGSDSDMVDELEPKVKFKQAMGFFAHLFLEYYFAKNEKAKQELMESTDFTHRMLVDSRCRAKAAAQWFLFSHCK